MAQLRGPASTPARQAALLFVISGLLSVLNCAVPGFPNYGQPVLLGASVASVVIGVACWFLPWDRWSPLSTVGLVPVALAIIVVSARFGRLPDAMFTACFPLLFGWVGMWHPPRVVIGIAPVIALAYVAPYLLGRHAQPGDLASVTMVIPVGIILGVIISRTVVRMREAERAQRAAAEALARASVTDELTGLGNRRAGNALLESMRTGDALMLLDLDRFKQVNDTFGHIEGDRLLAQLGAYLAGAARERDTVARFGGEEFIIVLRRPGLDALGAAEHLLRGWRLQHPLASFSVGVAIHDGGPALRTFGQADAALYDAKRRGRDCVAAAGAIPATPFSVIEGGATGTSA